MNDIFRKLMMKPGYRVALLHTPESYPKSQDDLAEGVHVTDESGLTKEPTHSFDLVHLFVSSVQELGERAPQALAAVKPAGFLWISYPKKSGKIKTDIHRDVGWDAVREAGFEGVSLISIDETWSAMRFRPAKH
jgi:hypothetical protein